jgi:hypothetical protein
MNLSLALLPPGATEALHAGANEAAGALDLQ